MAEYKDLKGGKVKNYTTNPDNPYEGQVWFNETEVLVELLQWLILNNTMEQVGQK
jgi:hypothetical protein